jgi:hypothetical protein
MGNMRRRLLGMLAAALAVSFPASAAAQEAERFSLAGDAVSVYNLAGAVRIEAGTGANVVVEVTRGGSDAASLRIERQQVAGRTALVVRYPGEDVVYRGGRWNGQTNLNVREDGTFSGEGDRGRRISVRSSGRGTEAHADLRILVPSGKNVAVRLGVGEVAARSVSGSLDIDVAAAAVQTTGTRGTLRIDTGSGSVRVSDAEGNVLVDTGSGSVALTGVRGDDLHVDTGSGGVTGSAITARSVLVDTGSGAIELSGVAATEVELDTGSGGVELELTTDVDNVRIDTGSGGVRVTVPASLGAAFDVETGSGGITVDLPVDVTHRSRDHVVGRIGDGRGKVEIDSGSGGVRIARR